MKAVSYITNLVVQVNRNSDSSYVANKLTIKVRISTSSEVSTINTVLYPDPSVNLKYAEW